MPATLTARGPFARHRLRRTLQLACRHAGLPDSEAGELLHITMNALYKLPTASAIVRIAPSAGLLPEAERIVQIAHWLAAADFPAVRLLPDVPQPLVIEETDHVVTFWRYLPQDTHPAPRAYELADPLRQLHHLPLPTFSLPPWDSTSAMRDRVNADTTLTPDDRCWLHDSISELDEQLAGLSYVLPHRGVIHGDAYVGNLLHDASGQPVLCDLDSLCTGPAEWDLVPELVACIRYQRSLADYDRLCARYGADIRTWTGWPTLRRLRELKVIASVLTIVPSSPGIGAEVRLRLRSLREGTDVQ